MFAPSGISIVFALRSGSCLRSWRWLFCGVEHRRCSSLGAEKALFRALKSKGGAPEYGLIDHAAFKFVNALCLKLSECTISHEI